MLCFMFCLQYKKRDMFKVVDCGATQKSQVNEKCKLVSKEENYSEADSGCVENLCRRAKITLNLVFLSR